MISQMKTEEKNCIGFFKQGRVNEGEAEKIFSTQPHIILAIRCAQIDILYSFEMQHYYDYNNYYSIILPLLSPFVC